MATSITLATTGPIHASVKSSSTIAPYLGLGYDSTHFSDSRWAIALDLGVIYGGKPTSNITAQHETAIVRAADLSTRAEEARRLRASTASSGRWPPLPSSSASETAIPRHRARARHHRPEPARPDRSEVEDAAHAALPSRVVLLLASATFQGKLLPKPRARTGSVHGRAHQEARMKGVVFLGDRKLELQRVPRSDARPARRGPRDQGLGHVRQRPAQLPRARPSRAAR